MNQDLKPQNSGSKKLFKNRILEQLSRTHISIPITIFVLYAFGLLYWSIRHTTLLAETTTVLFFTGFVVFTWVEYMTHRYVFHMRTYTKMREKVQYLIHGVHHEYPKDKDRLAMPPLISISMATFLLITLQYFLGDFVFAFLPGFLVGYAFYLLIHYIVHAARPPKNFLRVLWVNHSIHHYKSGHLAFGVSSPFWDFIYGTGMKKDVKTI